MVLKDLASIYSQSSLVIPQGLFIFPANTLCRHYCTNKSHILCFHNSNLFFLLNFSTSNFALNTFSIWRCGTNIKKYLTKSQFCILIFLYVGVTFWVFDGSNSKVSCTTIVAPYLWRLIMWPASCVWKNVLGEGKGPVTFPYYNKNSWPFKECWAPQVLWEGYIPQGGHVPIVIVYASLGSW